MENGALENVTTVSLNCIIWNSFFFYKTSMKVVIDIINIIMDLSVTSTNKYVGNGEKKT